MLKNILYFLKLIIKFDLKLHDILLFTSRSSLVASKILNKITLISIY